MFPQGDCIDPCPPRRSTSTHFALVGAFVIVEAQTRCSRYLAAPSPLSHLSRVDRIALRDLMQRLLFTQRLKRYYALKLRGKFTSLLHGLLDFNW